MLYFQENKDLFRKMFMLSVGRCGQKYLCKVSTLDFINKKVIELIFKLNIPFRHQRAQATGRGHEEAAVIQKISIQIRSMISEA